MDGSPTSKNGRISQNQSGKIGRLRSFWDGKISAAFCVGKKRFGLGLASSYESHLFRGETAKQIHNEILEPHCIGRSCQ